MRSGALSGMKRPSRRLSSATSSSRPASMRVLHQAPPPEATRLTRSPSRTPVLRNWATAALARWPPARVRWMSSKRITNERPASGLAVEVRGHVRAGRRLLAGDGRELHGLEVGDRLGIVVFGDHEVALGEAGDGHALLVRDDHVHGDDFHLAWGTSRSTPPPGTSGEAAGAGEGAGVWAATIVQAAKANTVMRNRVFFFMTNNDFWHRRGEKSIRRDTGWYGPS